MTTRSNRSDTGHRPQAGEVSGQESFWFLLGRLPKETRPESAKHRRERKGGLRAAHEALEWRRRACVGETPFIREANLTKRL
jgi:hypothetical protein